MSSITAYDLPARVATYDSDMDIMHPNRSKMINIALEFLPYNIDSPIKALDLGLAATKSERINSKLITDNIFR